MNIPSELKYTKEHEWVRSEGDVSTIGITDHAQAQLGDVVFVDLPAVGATLVAGKTFGTVESVKAVSDLYAPVSGVVVEVNATLKDAPEAVNGAPYAAGWMVKVKPANRAEVDGLLSADDYRRLTAG